MNKLLGLLSVVTISGIVTPSVIAASSYEKENLKLENNLENLHRIKRTENTKQQKVVIVTGNEIYSSGLVFNNKLYFGSYDNKVYEYNPATGQQKVVITATSWITSSGLVFNNKLYFGSRDSKVYEYDPATNTQKVVITAVGGWFFCSGVVLNNKLYFGSDGKVYEYNPATGQQKVVITTIGINGFSYSGVVLNNKLYFGSYNNKVYEYDPATNTQKVVIVTGGAIYSSGLVFNNKLYFGSRDSKVYEYDPATNTQKVVIVTGGAIYSSGLVFNNKLYFGSYDNKVYEYNPATGQQKVVITATGGIDSSGVVLNNKLYFGSDDNKVYEYNPATGQQKVVITATGGIDSSGVVLNNKLYFGSRDSKVYEYDPFLDINDVIIKTDLGVLNDNNKDTILASVKAKNPSLDISQVGVSVIKDTSADIDGSPYYNSNKYQGYKKVNFTIKPDLKDVITNTNLGFLNDNNDNTLINKVKVLNPILDINQVIVKDKKNNEAKINVKDNQNVYKTLSWKKVNFTIKPDLKDVITNFNLNLINDSDKAILNELNYLNPELDISQLEVINKKNTSAKIKSKNDSNKYFGEKKIYFIVNNEQNKNIVLYNLIKKAIFFKFKDDNLNLEFSKIKDIDFSYLQYSNIELKETITPKINIENVYESACTGESGLINNSSLVQILKTPECKKNLETEIRIQLSNGLIKSKSLEQGETLGKEKNITFGTNVSKINSKSLEIVDAFENVDIKQSSESSGYHSEIGVSSEASFNFGGVISGGVSTTNSVGTNKNFESSQSKTSGLTNSKSIVKSESNQKEEIKTKIISNSIGSSKFSSSSKNISLENTDSKSKTISEQITWPSQDIKVNPKSKVIVKIFIKKVTNQITLDLKQDISGNIIVKVENKDGEEEIIDFSIGELMQKLIKCKLLPPQISISEFDENDVYFEGKINFLIKKGFKQDMVID